MKTLQNYIIESIETSPVSEGRVWDAVKKWVKELFNPTDKKYDRWGTNKIQGVVAANYQTDLNDTFSVHNLSTKEIDQSALKTIVYPNGEHPDEASNTGFWKFSDDKVTGEHGERYWALIYEDDNIKDVAALIKTNVEYDKDKKEDYIRIDKLQIRNEFSTLLKLKSLINYMFNDYAIMNHSAMKGIVVLKDKNAELYEKVVNDCGFEKKTVNNKNIAIKKKDA